MIPFQNCLTFEHLLSHHILSSYQIAKDKKNSHEWNGRKLTWSQTISIWSKQNIEISILSFVFVHCNLSLHLSTPSALAFSSCILDDFARRRHHLKRQWCLAIQVFFLVPPSHKQGELVSPNLVLGITYLGVPKLFLLTLFI